MKTFKDLEFKKRDDVPGLFQAKLNFDNGYGISVIYGFGTSTNGDDSYEVGILCHGFLVLDSNLGYDVVGYKSSEEVTEIMHEIQNLKRIVSND